MEDLLLPSKKDALFKEFNEDHMHIAYLRSGISSLFHFSESYKIAGQKLFEILDNSGFYVNILVYPIVFMHRQFLELRLKELINCLNFIYSHQHSFPNGHNLEMLWNDYERLIIQTSGSETLDKQLFQSVKKLISEFNFFDPKSYSFRYPVDTSPERNPSFTITDLDLENFRIVMIKLINFFDSQIEWIYHLEQMTEEMINDFTSDYEKELQKAYEKEYENEMEREMIKEYEREMNSYYYQ